MFQMMMYCSNSTTKDGFILKSAKLFFTFLDKEIISIKVIVFKIKSSR